jgi:Cft2 family RNA processing exonuclease
MDYAHLQEHEAEFRQERHEWDALRGPYPEAPLYTTSHVKASFPLFRPVKYESPIEVGDGIEATFYDAGHVLGSSTIKFEIKQGGELLGLENLKIQRKNSCRTSRNLIKTSLISLALIWEPNL